MEKFFYGYLLVSDMDGTLLDSNGKLSKENKEAIDYFISKGGNFTLATGRTVESVGRFLSDINVTLPVILYNGAKIYDYKNNRVIYEKFIEDERKNIITLVKKDKPSLGIEVYSEEKVYIYSSCKYTNRFSKLGYEVIYNLPEDVWNKKWTKVLIVGEENEIDVLEENFIRNYGEGNIIRSGARYLEIVSNDTSKGKAIEKLIHTYNIKSYNLITIGDNMNDIEMIKLADYGFCIKTGAQRLINTSKFIAPSNDEHAIDYVVKWVNKNIVR
ncbi:Cof-type HAD-IIB family hydrolase [Clostridium taeniosporum]|uniref:HAD family hydrolase n=1 Tax=Clostridium taeniosporum TaxID=394958 RepID=A0A1D7XFX6_9CLOT|nr:Cof-type HAD-IIB family hydrolase [Clostridium taeniosporum]AOR22261.1 HAD family hydrolase [Clostridium taeniosporum]